jgi:hypothetical protein
MSFIEGPAEDFSVIYPLLWKNYLSSCGLLPDSGEYGKKVNRLLEWFLPGAAGIPSKHTWRSGMWMD